MKKFFLLIVISVLLMGVEYTKKEKEFLKTHPVIYIAAMKYWPLDSNGDSVHTNYLKLLNKYGHLNLQPLYYKYWSNAFNDAKKGNVYGILSLSFSNKRKKWFFYSTPYNFTPYYIIVNKDSDIHSLKDLKGKNIFVAKNSIIREALKGKGYHIVYTKKAFKKLADNQIDAIMLFYMPKTGYTDKFRIIKTYINRYGEEYLGISKKYPVLYSIIKKAQSQIPYSQLEKIREIHYHVNRPIKEILVEKVDFFTLFNKKEILIISFFILLFLLVLFLYFSKIFLKMSIKRFFLSVFVIYLFLVGIIIYEIAVYNYFSNKVLNLKNRSFNALYLIDKLNVKIVEWNLKYFKNNRIKNVKLTSFKIEGKPFGDYLNSNYFTDEEIKYISKLVVMFDELLKIQKQTIKHKINIAVYKQKLINFIENLDKLRDLIKTHNDKEIKIIKEKLKYQLLLLFITVFMLVVLSMFLFVMVKRKIYIPINGFTDMLKNKKNFLSYKPYTNDEISLMIKEIINLTKQLHDKINELQKHKSNLQEEIKKELKIRLDQEKMLLKQSKFALMGEMIDAIAHQWKQPLNTVYMRVGMLEMEDKIDKEYIKEFVKEINFQIEHLTQTLNEFRNFFRENREDIFCIKRIIENVLLLLKDELMRNSIEVKKEINVNFCIEGNENEFKHLLISLITNAKDIFILRNIKKREIIIKTYEDERNYYLEVTDNAGGIKNGIINKIFEPDFTTRKDGTGVGLYLAKKIALKHGGFLFAQNVENGAKFVFKIEK